MAQLQNQLKDLPAMMRTTNELLQPRTTPTPVPAQGSIPVTITIPLAPAPITTPVAPTPLGASPVMASIGAVPGAPTQPAIQVTHEQPGEASFYDFPETELDGTFTTSTYPNEKDKEWKKEFEKINEKFKAMEGSSKYDTWEVDDLCLYPKVEVPKKFKIPDFIKYDGTTNPDFHLRSYCTLMGNWSREESFLLAYFHYSLTGSAFN